MRVLKRSRPWSFIAVIIALLLISSNITSIEAVEAIEAIDVVTTIPVETSLGYAGTKKAADTWVEMINKAKETIDLAQFYLVTKTSEPLELVIDAIIKAADRGVNVRFLVNTPVNESMAKGNAVVEKRFAGHANISVTTFNWKQLTGGILHAKYFIVDNREIYVGSQNFDWRSLKHIHETGLRIKSRLFAQALTRIFEADREYNRGDKQAYQKLEKLKPLILEKDNFLVASPEAYSPPGIKSAIETLIQLLDNAQKKVTIQLLSYQVDIHGSEKKFTLIDDALRRAAGRGVAIKMVVADWNKRKPGINGLKQLAKLPNIEIKFATIPRFSKGFIPYARVIHSKVMRVDNNISWVGTSNWGHGYFYNSRNIEVVLSIPTIARTLDCLFNELWNSDYTYPLVPDKEYKPPRIK
jgi:phosphatidylserine/phosphatidylglycerophosphate/cardiolipin synthase-like enzyme